MTRSSLARVLAALVVCAALAHSTAAQTAPPLEALSPPLRPSGALYLRPQLGLAAYGGDRSSLGASLGAPGPVTGVEVGWRRPAFIFNGGYGLSLLLGRYPSIADPQAGAPGVKRGELNMWRHTLALSGYTELAPRSAVSPYLRLGAGVTGGLVDERVRMAFTPLAGFGLDIAMNDAVGVFVEASGLLSFADGILDGAADVSTHGFDVLSFFGGGVRVGLNKPFVPIDVIAIEGPAVVQVGGESTYSVVARGQASGPVAYVWRFGDGGQAEGAVVAHRFAKPGNYTIAVTAENQGSRDEQLLAVSVEAAPAPVIVEATPPPAEAPPVRVPSTVACAEVVELNTVRFEQGRTAFSSRTWEALEENAEVMRQCPGLTVRILVYETPDEAPSLSDRRAEAVETFYAARGIGADRIVAVQVVTPGGRVTQKEGLAQLRRVETVPVAVTVASERTPPTAIDR